MAAKTWLSPKRFIFSEHIHQFCFLFFTRSCRPISESSSPQLLHGHAVLLRLSTLARLERLSKPTRTSLELLIEKVPSPQMASQGGKRAHVILILVIVLRFIAHGRQTSQWNGGNVGQPAWHNIRVARRLRQESTCVRTETFGRCRYMRKSIFQCLDPNLGSCVVHGSDIIDRRK